MAGRPPSVDPVRRNARVGPLLLPAEGRQGAVPDWPLDTPATPAFAQHELEIWAQLWRTPQSVQWERQGWIRVVARYCRTLLAAEGLDKDCMAEARQLEDRLGLTPKSMRMLLWQVVDDEVGERRTEKAAESARGRIKAVG
jgi:hypothetical protein